MGYDTRGQGRSQEFFFRWGREMGKKQVQIYGGSGATPPKKKLGYIL